MKTIHFFIGLCIILLFFTCPLSARAQEAAGPAAALQETVPPAPPPPGAQSAPPPVKEISPGVFEVGGVRIFKKEDRVEFPAQVNMTDGLLEYLLVSAGGKLHESLLKTDIEPFHLQVALLMLGLKGSSQPLREQGDPATPQGDQVMIWITVKKGDVPVKLRIEDWVAIKDQSGETSPMRHGDFVFTGSIVRDGIFMAQMDKSIIALFHDPLAMFDNPAPEGGSDEVWYVNRQTVLPAGTNVTIGIQAKKGRKP